MKPDFKVGDKVIISGKDSYVDLYFNKAIGTIVNKNEYYCVCFNNSEDGTISNRSNLWTGAYGGKLYNYCWEFCLEELDELAKKYIETVIVNGEYYI